MLKIHYSIWKHKILSLFYRPAHEMLKHVIGFGCWIGLNTPETYHSTQVVRSWIHSSLGNVSIISRHKINSLMNFNYICLYKCQIFIMIMKTLSRSMRRLAGSIWIEKVCQKWHTFMISIVFLLNDEPGLSK